MFRNHYDVLTGEDYWVSEVKKQGSNRHWNGGGPIYIEKSLVERYEAYVHQKDFNGLIEIPDLSKPDISNFNSIENERMVDLSGAPDAPTGSDGNNRTDRGTSRQFVLHGSKKEI
jgi:hypothetical protein